MGDMTNEFSRWYDWWIDKMAMEGNRVGQIAPYNIAKAAYEAAVAIETYKLAKPEWLK